MEDRKKQVILNEFDWVLIGLAWLIALGLGYYGFLVYFQQSNITVSVFDLVYLTLQLVMIESGSVTMPIPWQLEVARFVLPLLAAFTAIKTLAVVFLEQAQVLRLYFIRGHVVICGLNNQGFLLGRGFIERGEKVVFIDSEETNPWREEARSIGAAVVQGDPDREDALVRAAVARAGKLICVHQDDRLNVQTAVQAQRIVSEKRGSVLPTYIHVVQPQLWDIFQMKALGSRDFANLRLELFNIYDRGAKVLLQETLAVDPVLDWRAGRLLVLGMGNLGQALVLHAARAAFQASNGEEDQLQVMVIDRDAVERCAALEYRYPKLQKNCRLVPMEMDFSSTDFARGTYLYDGEGNPAFDAVYLCLEDDSLNLNIILTLFHHLQHLSVPVFIRSKQEEGLEGVLDADAEIDTLSSLFMFPLLDRTSTPDILREGNREVLAISLHQEYVRSQLKAGVDSASPALKPWPELSEQMREANRKQVDRMQGHLMDLGYSIMPDPEWGEQVQRLTEEEVERVACMEHNGWCKDLRRDGWKYAPGSKDPKKKTHPALVSWEELSEVDREKNRVPVREFPDVLASLGFKIVRLR